MNERKRIDIRRLGRPFLHPTLLLNVAAPMAAFQILTNHGVSTLDALLVAAVFPLASVVLSAIRTGRLDAFAILSLAAIAFGVGGGLLFQDPHFPLVKDSVVTGVFGATCLFTAPTTRPLIHLIGRQFVAGTDRAALDRYDSALRAPDSLARVRRLTVIWGIALMAEAAIRVSLSFALTPVAMVVASPMLAVAVFGPLAWWTLSHRAAAGLPAPIPA